MTNPIDELIEKLALIARPGVGDATTGEYKASCEAAASALSSLQEQKRKLEDGLQTIHDLCDDEIKARFRSGSSLSEAEAAKNSRVYPLLALPRNIARALLSGAGE